MSELERIVNGIINATIDTVRDRLAANGRADLAALLREPIDLEAIDRELEKFPPAGTETVS